MSEDEQELQEAMHQILGFLSRAPTREEMGRQEYLNTVQGISQQTGLCVARVEEAVAKLVADGKLKPIIGVGEDFYILPKCE